MKLLAQTPGGQDVQNLFGTVKPPSNAAIYDNPVAGLGMLISLGIQLFLVFAGLALLIYLLWGAYDWISSGGDKEKLGKARQKITNAILGIILAIVALSIFGVVAGDILGIVRKDSQGNWFFNIPTLEQGQSQGIQNQNNNPGGGFQPGGERPQNPGRPGRQGPDVEQESTF
jgi:hypothetical protein